MTPKNRERIGLDRPLLLATLLLVGVGLVMVFSASAMMAEERFGAAYLFLRKQVLWDGLGLAALFLFMRVDYHRWQKAAYPLLILSFLALILVLIVGPVVKGARRWIHLGGFSFQPSEIAKLALILTLANFLDRHQSHLKDFWKGFVPVMILLGSVCGLILAEPDLGTPMMLSVVGMTLLFLSGAQWKHMAGTALAALGPLYFLLFHVAYRRRRLMAFLNPWADPGGTGYQITHSLLAFGSGGFWGKGLGASKLKLLYLPDPHTDFIFPIIGEELGFVGALGLILLFIFWGLRGWQVVKWAPDLFGQLLASGITSWVLLQAAINMGVSCGLLPTKGLPLPLVSFGGSSVLITLTAVGILMNISAQGRQQRFQTLRSR